MTKIIMRKDTSQHGGEKQKMPLRMGSDLKEIFLRKILSEET